jgi:hypothetical protein
VTENSFPCHLIATDTSFGGSIFASCGVPTFRRDLANLNE